MNIFLSLMALLGGLALVYFAAILIAALAGRHQKPEDDLDDWR